MRRLTASLILAFLLSIVAGVAWAHHSRSDVDMTKRVTLRGTLARLDWRNPHVEFVVEVAGANGQIDAWSIETGSPSALSLRKITKAIFTKAIGQMVTVDVSGAKDGSHYGTCWTITFADKTTAVLRQ